MKKNKVPFLLLILTALLSSIALAETPSGELYAYEAVIDGVLYQFPCPFSVFEERGWTFKEKSEADEMLAPSRYTNIDLTKGPLGEKMEIRASFLNYDIHSLPHSQCYVGGVKLETPYKEDDAWATAVTAGGITLGVSNREDIVAAYGEPTDLYESSSSDRQSLTYSTGSYKEVKFTVEDGVLNAINVQNFDEPEGVTKSAVSEEIPEYILAYTVPTALGDDLLSLIVEFAGDLYQMPAPVSAFEENGWTIMATRHDYVEARGFSVRGVTLMRDNQSADFSLRNLSDLAVLPQNCVIDSLNPIGSTHDFTLVLSGGIAIGSTEDDLLSMYEDVLTDVEKRDDTKRYKCAEWGKYSIYFTVDNASGLVEAIDYSVP